MSDLHLNERDLETLEGLNIPAVVDGSFRCDFNKLTSLEFGPKEVEGNFKCSNNLLTSLKFGPEVINSNYWCTGNKLTSLEFCASKIGGCLYTFSNLVPNLKGIHKQFKNGYIGDTLFAQQNPLKSHILGVILIPRLRLFVIDNDHLQKILNKHIQGNRDVLDCQEQLIQNGYKEFAQL